MVSQEPHFAAGRPPDVSSVSGHQEASVSTLLMGLQASLATQEKAQANNLTSTPGLAVPSSEQISIAKSTTSKKRTLDTCSSRISRQASTSKGPAFVPFWNEHSPAWSRRLWSCTATGLLDSASSSWTSSSQKLALGSWFTVAMKVPQTSAISLTTSSQSQHSLSRVITDAEQQRIARDDEKKREQAAKRRKIEQKNDSGLSTKQPRQKKVYENPMRARRIRLYPSPEQEQGLLRFFGAVRYCYNALVEKYRTVGQGGVTLAACRSIIASGPDWLKEIPYEIRDVAVQDFDKARKAHFAKLKKKQQNHPTAKHDAKFKFRSKRDSQQSFEVRPRDLVRSSGAMAFLNLSRLRGAEEIPKETEAAARFIRDRLGRYFLALPRQITKRSETQAPSSREGVVALDPGVRTFQTTYDADGLATEWGKGDMCHLFRICRVADKLQASWKDKKGSKRRATKLAWHRVLDRIKNMVKELHCKLASWLCETYKVVLVPRFESSRMVTRGQRKINSKTARGMLTWSHFAFRSLLKAKAELYPWVTVIECDEPYTSKTCGCCGTINQKLGGSKTFHCATCNYTADRDINAARNILLRFLSLLSEQEGLP